LRHFFSVKIKVGTDIKVTDDNSFLYLFSENPSNGEKEVYFYTIN